MRVPDEEQILTFEPEMDAESEEEAPVENFPAGQAAHDDAPDAFMKYPGEQGVQAPPLGGKLEYVPTPQAMLHSNAPGKDVLPAGQSVH
jgi:hypothetical protein